MSGEMLAQPVVELLAACSNCVYFRPGAHHENKDGVCRRHPPQQWTDESEPEEESHSDGPDEDGVWTSTVSMTTYKSYTGWPDVNAHDWCGEHQLSR